MKKFISIFVIVAMMFAAMSCVNRTPAEPVEVEEEVVENVEAPADSVAVENVEVAE